MDNSKIQGVIEKQVLSVAKAVEEAIDDEIAALDRLDVDDIETLRETRLIQMRKMAEKKQRWISLGHGDYSEIPSQRDFFTAVKASDRVVCHFYREKWPCKVMYKHLCILSKQHIETRFVKIQAFLGRKTKGRRSPHSRTQRMPKWMTMWLGCRTDEFSTEELEERLARSKVIFFEGESSLVTSKHGGQTRRSVRQSSNPDSSDSLLSRIQGFSIRSIPRVLKEYIASPLFII